MIQRPASGTFDLELGKHAHSCEQALATATTAFIQHLHSLLESARLAALSREWGALAGLQLTLLVGGLSSVCQHRLRSPSLLLR